MTYKPSRLQEIALIACQALLFSLFGLIPAARAQFSGIATVGPVTFTVTNCNGMIQSNSVPDLGQSVHFVAYNATGNPTTLRVWMADAGSSTFPTISDVGTDPTSLTQSGGVITANGYYHSVVIDTTCTGGSSPVVTLVYTGTSANSVPTTGLQDQTSWFKPVVVAVPENVTQSFPSVTAPFGNSCGQLFFVPNQGSNSGTLSIVSTGLTGSPIATYPIPGAFASSIFNVPCQPAQGIQVSYTQGTPNSGTYAIYYVFYKPGFFPNLTSPNSGTSSTLPIQVISDTVSQAFNSSDTVTNPGSGAIISFIDVNNGARGIYFDKLVLSATAAASISILPVTNCTTCTVSSTISNDNIGSTVASIAVNHGTPTTTAGGFPFIFLAANQTITFDLRGFIAPAGTLRGLAVVSNAAQTTVVTAVWSFYEK